jgi:hypothetical protein
LGFGRRRRRIRGFGSPAAAGNGNGNGNRDKDRRRSWQRLPPRHITALGTAVNVAMPGSDGLGSDGEETRNPWTRIVPCGLPGKEVTSVAWEFARRSEGLDGEGFRVGVGVVDEMLLQQVRPGRIARTREQAVAEVWAEVFAGGIGLGNEDPDGGVEMVDTEEVLGLMEELTRLAEKTGDGQDGQVTPEEAEYLGRIRMLL